VEMGGWKGIKATAGCLSLELLRTERMEKLLSGDSVFKYMKNLLIPVRC